MPRHPPNALNLLENVPCNTDQRNLAVPLNHAGSTHNGLLYSVTDDPPQFSLETHRTLFNSTRYSLPRSPSVSMSARPKTYVTPTGAGSGRSVSCRTHKHAQTNVFAHSWNTVQVFQRIRRCQTEPRGKHAQTDVIVRGSFLFTMFKTHRQIDDVNDGKSRPICRRQIFQGSVCPKISVFLYRAANKRVVEPDGIEPTT